MAVPDRSGENGSRVSVFEELVARDPGGCAGTGQGHAVADRWLLQIGCQSWSIWLIFMRKEEKCLKKEPDVHVHGRL